MRAVRKIFGRPASRTAMDVICTIRDGVPYDSVTIVAETYGITVEDLHRLLGLSKRTAARRIQTPRPLNSHQTERLYRCVQVFEYAFEVLEARDKALAWIHTPNLGLDNQQPFDMLDTGVGYERVMEVLRSIEFGIYG